MRRWRRLTIACVLTSAAVTGCGSGGSNKSHGFDSPEAAITDFVDGLRTSDLARSLADFAVDQSLTVYDGRARETYIQTLIAQGLRFPGADGNAQTINRAMLDGEAASQLLRLISSLLAPDVDLSQPTVDTDGSAYDAWAKSLQLNRLSALSITDPVSAPGQAVASQTQYQTLNAAQAKIYGADQLTERVWLYQLDGATYIGGADLVHYTTGWKLLRLGAVFADLDASGAVKPGTQADIDQLLASDG